MHTQKSITIVSNRRKRTLSVNHILYIHMRRKHADVHMDNGEQLIRNSVICSGMLSLRSEEVILYQL